MGSCSSVFSCCVPMDVARLLQALAFTGRQQGEAVCPNSLSSGFKFFAAALIIFQIADLV